MVTPSTTSVILAAMPSITGVDAKQSDATDADWPSKETDVGFHLIADSLKAPIVKLNVVPGNG